MELIAEKYKKTEIGIIPDDWEVISISKVITLMTNGFVGTVKSHYTENDNGVLYIQGYNVEENAFNYNGIKRVSEEFHKNHSKSCLQEGDLLTIQTGDIGVTTVVPKNLSGSNCHALIITRFKKGVADPKFYSYYFNFSSGRRQLKEIETGSTMKHINVGDMFRLTIPFPPKSEQTAIATAISDMDALISSLEKLIEKKRMIKQGAMQVLLKPKEGWENVTLFELAEFKKELFDDGDWVEAEHITTEGVRLIQTGNIGVGKFKDLDSKKYIFERSFTHLQCKPLHEGDLLICRLADPAGRACVFPNISEDKVITSVDVTIFRPREEIANRTFLSYVFSTNEWFKMISEKVGGTTHKRISRSALGKLKIQVPCIKIQAEIASVLSGIDKEIDALNQLKDKYALLKKGMMQSLLTGKIRLV